MNKALKTAASLKKKKRKIKPSTKCYENYNTKSAKIRPLEERKWGKIEIWKYKEWTFNHLEYLNLRLAGLMLGP